MRARPRVGPAPAGSASRQGWTVRARPSVRRWRFGPTRASSSGSTTRPSTPDSTTAELPDRRLPVGAELVPAGVSFRVWAPGHRSVTLIAGGPDRAALALVRDGDAAGHWHVL